MFHDESHRKVAPNYWKFWLSQQKNQQTARAIDIDQGRSVGVHNIETRWFDRITFQWNGKAGATINIRFNCLSTDFSRIKGVKGIPLRLHMETHVVQSEQQQQQHQVVETAFCRIKLFRDKGAERKNKDDAKHIEKQLEKLRGNIVKWMHCEENSSVSALLNIYPSFYRKEWREPSVVVSIFPDTTLHCFLRGSIISHNFYERYAV